MYVHNGWMARTAILVLLSLTLDACAALKHPNRITHETEAYAGNAPPRNQSETIQNYAVRVRIEFEKRGEKLIVDKTSCPTGLVEAGFDVNGKNVAIYVGARGSEYFLGKNAQITNIVESADELRQYMTYAFKIVGLTEYEKLVWIHHQDIPKFGTDGEYFITCKEGRVFVHGFHGTPEVDTVEHETKMFGNIGAILLGGMAFLALKFFP